MTPSIVAVLAIGGLLGLRHAFEPDHLAAVSTLASRPGARLWSAARLGLIWGLGHSVTVGVVVLVIIAFGVQVPERFWPAAELLVAAWVEDRVSLAVSGIQRLTTAGPACGETPPSTRFSSAAQGATDSG